MEIKNLRLISFLLLAWLLAACAGALPQPTTDPGPFFTQGAQTVIAQLTQNPPATALPAPTETPLPTALVETLTLPTDTVIPTTAVPTAIPASPTLAFTETVEPTEIPAATQTPVPEATVEPSPGGGDDFELVFADDFDRQVGWVEGREDDWGFQFTRGGYAVTVRTPSATIWSVKSQEYDDVRVEVGGVAVEGQDNGYYGVVCRHRNGSNYYAFLIGQDGSYMIQKQASGQTEILLESTAPASVIHMDGTINRVRADCVGDTLALYANEQKLAEIEDREIADGATGLAVRTRNQPNEIEVAFDNFAVYAP